MSPREWWIITEIAVLVLSIIGLAYFISYERSLPVAGSVTTNPPDDTKA